jgi:hypothetical protein
MLVDMVESMIDMIFNRDTKVAVWVILLGSVSMTLCKQLQHYRVDAIESGSNVRLQRLFLGRSRWVSRFFLTDSGVLPPSSSCIVLTRLIRSNFSYCGYNPFLAGEVSNFNGFSYVGKVYVSVEVVVCLGFLGRSFFEKDSSPVLAQPT